MKPFQLRSRLIVPLALLLPPLLLLATVTLGKKTLLPTDNLIAFEPWASAAADLNLRAPEAPHNALLSDLILENYAWKRFIRQAIATREIPLWNPYLFGGVPFLASGQHSLLYPFSLIFYVFPLAKAYGWFMLSQYFLAGVTMYLFARTLHITRCGALVGASVYQLSLFMVVSAVFPMIVAGSVWLPLLLLAVESILQQRPLFGHHASLPWMVIGAVSIGLQMLAGHPEVVAYSLLMTAAYTAWQLVPLALSRRRRTALRPAVFIGGMAAFGFLLGALQFLPLLEAADNNFRTAAASLSEVRGWGYPPRRLITLLLPNFFGNPSHHGYFDWFAWRWIPVSLNALGERITTIDWGVKNYVEGGMYVGVLPLLLAAVALLSPGRRRNASEGRRPVTWFFAVFAALSLAFAFGTPLYALLYHLPGLSQLHSPFRWVWPFSLCVAALAALGVDLLSADKYNRRSTPTNGLARFAMLTGSGLILTVALTLAFYAHAEPFIQRAFLQLARATSAFADARMFFSYQARWLLQLGFLLLLSGMVLWKTARSQGGHWRGALLALLLADLFIAGYGFNPSSNPDLLHYTPPVVEFLQQDDSAWRFTTYDPEGQKLMNANSGWLFDMQDVRGYDSIIPSQYANYMTLIEPQHELAYNRIAPISTWQGLHSPLLDLLNVKYVLSQQEIYSPQKYTLVYQGELRVYRNIDVSPRAFTLTEGCAFSTPDFAAALREYDPRHFIALQPDASDRPSRPTEPERECQPEPANITASSLNEMHIEANLQRPGYMLLADSYAPGWQAFVQSEGAPEERQPVLRANGNFRAVHLNAGQHQVRFKYIPASFRLGGLASALSVLTLVLLSTVWAWRSFYREQSSSPVHRVAKNSMAPMGFSLLNRAIDFIFAMFYLRVLGPAEAGNYATAIVIIGWFDIWTNFGLNTWLSREASRDRAHANRFLSNTTVLRVILGGVTLPVFLGGIALYQRHTGTLGDDTVLAIALLAVGMLFSSVSTGLTALFYAYEKAEYPAVISSLTTVLKVAFGVGALLLGYGFIGLAGVTIVVNAITMSVLTATVWRLFFRPRAEFDIALQRDMVSESFPLMLNHLLATLFFKIDIPMIRTMRGEAEVGRYGTAYKFVDAFNIIPSFFTFALFPLMSRQAAGDRPALTRTYHLAIKLMVAVALPLAVATTFLAAPMVGLLGGREFLPDGAIALQLIIWSIPFGWINSVTNYLLVAIGQQRALTRAFVIAVTFNIVINAMLIPLYGFRAAAISTILSEIVIGAAFQWYVFRHLSPTPWRRLFWRLGAATLLMAAATWLGARLHLLLGLMLGGIIYLAATIFLGVFAAPERKLLAELLPAPVRKHVAPLSHE